MLEYIVEYAARAWSERRSLQAVVLALFALVALVAATVPAVLLIGFLVR